MAEIEHRSALAHRSDIGDYKELPVALSEVAGLAMIDLRLAPGDEEGKDAAGKAIGVPLPAKPRSSASKGNITVLWLSVDQWLVTLPIARRSALFNRLNKALSGSFALVVDVSDARAVIRLQGDGAREVLMKGGCPDLTRPGFEVGSVRRMLFAEIAAMCHFVDKQPETLDLYVFRSYADYAWEWLVQTAHPNALVHLWRPQTLQPV